MVIMEHNGMRERIVRIEERGEQTAKAIDKLEASMSSFIEKESKYHSTFLEKMDKRYSAKWVEWLAKGGLSIILTALLITGIRLIIIT